MDSTAIPWIMLASAIAAVASAIAAAISSYYSSRSSRTAANAAAIAADAAATTLILKFRDQYATNEMLIDLRKLREWQDKHGPNFAATWRDKFRQNDEEALIVDASRRRVSHFFSSIVDLRDAGLVPKRTEKLLTDFDGLDLLYSVVEPLERELNPGYDKTRFDKLRELRPPLTGRTRHLALDPS